MAGEELTLYGLKNCDTCKNAIGALEAVGRDVTFVDIRAEADLAAKVPQWLSALGADVLVNKRSTTWRGLAAAEQKTASGSKAGATLVAHPTLIKRPVIETGGAVYAGWTKDVQAAVCAT